jgi:hypothetical protein
MLIRVVKSGINQISNENSCPNNVSFVEVKVQSFQWNDILVSYWSCALYDICLGRGPCIYVVPKNVIEERLGFWSFSFLETDILECCIEVVEDFDGKIDSVQS